MCTCIIIVTITPHIQCIYNAQLHMKMIYSFRSILLLNYIIYALVHAIHYTYMYIIRDLDLFWKTASIT